MAIPTKINCFQFSGKQNKISLYFLIGILAVVITYVHCKLKIETVYSWTKIDWPNLEKAENCVMKNVKPHDIDVDKGGRVFISFRGRYGVPATLGVIDTEQNNSKAEFIVKPYPDWKMFNANDCNSINDVQKIWIDKCNRLWVLDSGQSENNNVSCAQKLLLFDLNENKLIDRRELGWSRFRARMLGFFVRTQGSTCQDSTVAYVFSNLFVNYPYKVVNYTSYKLENISSVCKQRMYKDFYDKKQVSIAFSPDTDSVAYREGPYIKTANITQLEPVLPTFQNVTFYSEFGNSQMFAFVFLKRNMLYFGTYGRQGIGYYNIYTKSGTPIFRGTENLSEIISLKVLNSDPYTLWVLSGNGTESNNLTNETIQYQISKIPVYKNRQS